MTEEKLSQDNIQNMVLCDKSNASAQLNDANISTDEAFISLEENILSCIANSKAIFKSQQKDDPDLTFEEKYTIAQDVLKKSHSLFLSKFGLYLKEEHLKYFSKFKDKDVYEISYHLNRLQRYFNNATRQIDIKNRRYEALKILIEKGEYFSECEMMNRNPLLYEHLVGQYMTDEEKRARDNADMKDITLLNILLKNIEKDEVKECRKRQEDEENSVLEESDSDDNSTDICIYKQPSSSNKNSCQWSESKEKICTFENKKRLKMKPKSTCKISNKEIEMLKQEFVTNMYQSFLDGKDHDFDYSTVDDNDIYDNVDLREQDEEEKYFDSESPETVLPESDCPNQNESEDELDAYMKSLKVK